VIRGAHVNVSGIGINSIIEKQEKPRSQATIEFLTKSKAKKWYATLTNEYPVVEVFAARKSKRCLD